jgi:hypothetical protein
VPFPLVEKQLARQSIVLPVSGVVPVFGSSIGQPRLCCQTQKPGMWMPGLLQSAGLRGFGCLFSKTRKKPAKKTALMPGDRKCYRDAGIGKRPDFRQEPCLPDKTERTPFLDEFTLADQSRMAIRTFKTIADAALLRGYYRMGGRTGNTLETALRSLSPEIYGSMNDSRSIELNGLEYVIDRLPKGIEACHRIVMTAREDYEGASFEKIQPLKRRRVSYRISPTEMSFVITRGHSEIYDILTHMTFLYIEAKKIHNRMRDDYGHLTTEWQRLESQLDCLEDLCSGELDQALWNLSLLLGRTFDDTKKTYTSLEASRKAHGSNNGLFHIIHSLGKLVDGECEIANAIAIHFTPSLSNWILNRTHARQWAAGIKSSIRSLDLQDRPLHIISANLHSMVNLLYGYAACGGKPERSHDSDLYEFIKGLREKEETVRAFAEQHGCHMIPDASGSQIDCQLIDTRALASVALHPELAVPGEPAAEEDPVLLVMDYAFGEQAFELMDELLYPWPEDGGTRSLSVRSISIIGKAGILPGDKGDIMLANAHVLEGTPHNYIIHNDLDASAFDSSVNVYTGPIITVLGTSLQNRYVLKKFQDSSWKAVGLEMEGGHYQRAINAAIIRGHVSKEIRIRYAYYASDNPLKSGQTLASGSMGQEGIKPTYMTSKIILQKILAGAPALGQEGP